MKKIKYYIQKHNNLGDKVIGNYVLWKESHSEHEYGCCNGYGCRGIFQGTREECKMKLKEVRG